MRITTYPRVTLEHVQRRSLDDVVLALDVDGVLLDADRGGRGRWNGEVEAHFGISPSDLRSAFFQRSWPAVIVGEQSVEDALQDAITRNAWPFGVDEFLQFWFATDYVPETTTIEWAARWGDAGVRLVLATNQEHRRAEHLRDHLGSRLAISDVCYSADLGVVKLDPRFFETAAQRLDIDPAGQVVVFVDDEAANVDSARQAGWQAVHAGPDHTWRSAVDAIIDGAGRTQISP